MAPSSKTLARAKQLGPSLRRELLRWFDAEKRDLPWRRTKDPYAIWLSEVMLQQTQVATVIPYYQRFLEKFPSVHSLAAAPEGEVLNEWKGLGYYSRARNLHRCAQEVSGLGGRFPQTAEALEELPGFGRYTAGAVASIAFDAHAPLVDGNVARVLSRLFVIEGATGDRARESQLWALAETLVQGDRPGDWNQALMELGARVCRPESPTCLLCPLREHCGALRAGRTAELPPPRVRAPRKALRFALGAWERNGAWLLGRRASRGLFGGLWELPGAEWDGEADVARLLSDVLGVELQIEAPLGEVRRTLTHRDLSLSLFRIRAPRHAKPESQTYAELRFVTELEREQLGISTAMAKALALVLDAAVAPVLQSVDLVTPSKRQSGERQTKTR